MRTLVYKRTHNGDPCTKGIFGCHDCMGQVRNWNYEAVIGIGGIGEEAERNSIARKVNWIGIDPIKCPIWPLGYRGPLVRFKHFKSVGDEFGEDCIVPTNLYHRMYTGGVRATMSFNRATLREIDSLLTLAIDSAPSSGRCSHSPGCTYHVRHCDHPKILITGREKLNVHRKPNQTC